MSEDLQNDLCVLASIFKSKACEMFAGHDKNQAHFLSANIKTNQTVVAVVAEGRAAELLLQYLDSQTSERNTEITR